MLNKIISTLFFLVLLFIIIKSISSSIKNLNIYVYYFSKIFKQIFIFYFQPASVCGYLISWKCQIESKFSNNIHFCYLVRVKISEIYIIPEILFLKRNGLCCNILYFIKYIQIKNNLQKILKQYSALSNLFGSTCGGV